MELEDYLKEYKALTLDIMERVNIDGNISFLINERQKIIDKIKYSGFDKSNIKRVSERLNLIKLEDELNLMIKKEKANIKRKIENLKKMRNANMKYNAIGYVSSKFNKKI